MKKFMAKILLIPMLLISTTPNGLFASAPEELRAVSVSQERAVIDVASVNQTVPAKILSESKIDSPLSAATAVESFPSVGNRNSSRSPKPLSVSVQNSSANLSSSHDSSLVFNFREWSVDS